MLSLNLESSIHDTAPLLKALALNEVHQTKLTVYLSIVGILYVISDIIVKLIFRGDHTTAATTTAVTILTITDVHTMSGAISSMAATVVMAVATGGAGVQARPSVKKSYETRSKRSSH